jgi:CubicO group peptidase (beta-lactamase class C family)
MGLRRLLVVLAAFAALEVRAESALEEIYAFVQAQIRAHGIPGLSLAIIQNGKVVHARGFGAEPSTPFLLGSMSKSFTAVAVLQQVEAKRLELDAPVRRYLPWFQLADDAAAASLTVRQLLHHTSGLPAGTEGDKNAGFTLEEHVRALSTVVPREPAGTKHRYSSSNYLVLGLLVEKVSNEKYADYVQRHIFQPLEMASSFTSLEAARSHGLSPGHRLWAGFPVEAQLAEEAGRLSTAALISSAEDLAKFLLAQMGDGPHADLLLTPGSRALMQAPVAEAENFSYAMGWRVGNTAGVPSLWHGGALPNYRGAMVFSPAEHWGIVVLSNLGSYGVDHTRGIAKGITARLARKDPPSADSPLIWISRLLCMAVLAPVLVSLRNLAGVRRWQAKGSRKRAVGIQAFALAFCLLMAVALPRVIGVPLWAIYEASPDLVLGMATLLLLGALLAVLRLRIALKLPVA